MPKISYAQAINQAMHQIMRKDKSVIFMGLGVNSPWYVGSTAQGLFDKFGPERVIDTPVSENAFSGAGIGAAMAGLKPVIVHPRMDFMYLAMDQIINHAGNWHYMFGGKVNVPVTIRGIINRGGEQAAQHSQALQAIFSHVPGIKVVMPSNAYDAKGLLISAIQDPNPVLYIDNRWLYDLEQEVPDKIYQTPISRAEVKKKGKDLTIIATSYMVQQALKAAQEFKNIEIIDLRSIKPIDTDLIFKSIKKTGKLIIADSAWKTCGVASEISALVIENIFKYLKAPIIRITQPDMPAPASYILEKKYYPNYKDIIKAIRKII